MEAHMAGMTWEMFFQMMVAEEKAAHDKYKLAMENAESPQLKKVFERLMNEEAIHAEVLEGEYERLVKKAKV
jgi:rubrerythrin